jgi:hypothetical protein
MARARVLTAALLALVAGSAPMLSPRSANAPPTATPDQEMSCNLSQR